MQALGSELKVKAIINVPIGFYTNNTKKMQLSETGNLAVGEHGSPPAITHKTNTSITPSQSTAGTWSATSGEAGTYSNRGAIEAAGVYNRHFYKWGFSGNLAGQSWYPFAKRSELNSAANQTGSGSEDGFALYFRIYTYLSRIVIPTRVGLLLSMLLDFTKTTYLYHTDLLTIYFLSVCQVMWQFVSEVMFGWKKVVMD